MGEVDVHSLRGVDVEMRAGEFVVILGASASGKCTLLRILGGWDVPTSGIVVFREHFLSDAHQDELTEYRSEHFGFVFPFYNLIATLTPTKDSLVPTARPSHPPNDHRRG